MSDVFANDRYPSQRKSSLAKAHSPQPSSDTVDIPIDVNDVIKDETITRRDKIEPELKSVLGARAWGQF